MAARTIGQSAMERDAVAALARQLQQNAESYIREGISTSELLSTMRRVAGFLEDMASEDAYTRRISARILTHR